MILRLKNSYPFAIVGCFLFIFTYVALAYSGFILSFEEGQKAGDLSKWGERLSGGIFREPSNTLSNLAFIVSGLLMLKILSSEESKAASGNEFLGLSSIGVLYAGATLFLGPGSFLMHGTNTYWGGWADNLSMVTYIIFPWLYNLKEMGDWRRSTFFISYFCIAFLYGTYSWIYGSRLGIGLDLFGLSIGLWIISESLFRFWSQRFRWLSGLVGFFVASIFGISPWEIFSNFGEYWWVLLFWIPGLFAIKAPNHKRTYSPWFFVGMAVYFLAFMVWLQGYAGSPYCNPDSWLQPHAIWHILTAFSTFCFFNFFRTERPSKS